MWTVNFQMFKLDVEKAGEPEIKLSSKKLESSRKTSTSALLTMPKPLTVWITTNCGKFFKRWKPDHLTYFLRNLYAGQEATVRTRHVATHWFQIGKGVHQGCILSPCRVCVLVTQLWPTLWDPMDYSPPGFFVHGIFQARILKWVSISFSRGSKQGSNPGLLHCRQMLYPQNY